MQLILVRVQDEEKVGKNGKIFFNGYYLNHCLSRLID